MILPVRNASSVRKNVDDYNDLLEEKEEVEEKLEKVEGELTQFKLLFGKRGGLMALESLRRCYLLSGEAWRARGEA